MLETPAQFDARQLKTATKVLYCCFAKIEIILFVLIIVT